MHYQTNLSLRNETLTPLNQTYIEYNLPKKSTQLLNLYEANSININNEKFKHRTLEETEEDTEQTKEIGNSDIILYLDITLQSVLISYTSYKLYKSMGINSPNYYNILKTGGLFLLSIGSQLLENFMEHNIFSRAINSFCKGALMFGVYETLKPYEHKQKRISECSDFLSPQKNQDVIEVKQIFPDFGSVSEENEVNIIPHFPNSATRGIQQNQLDLEKSSQNIIQPDNIQVRIIKSEINPAQDTLELDCGDMEQPITSKWNTEPNQPVSQQEIFQPMRRAVEKIIKYPENQNQGKKENVGDIFRNAIAQMGFLRKIESLGEKVIKEFLHKTAAVGFVGAAIPNLSTYTISQIYDKKSKSEENHNQQEEIPNYPENN